MYTVVISRAARQAIDQVPATDGRRIYAAIKKLAQHPRPPTAKKLVGRAGWRIRVGNYRVIYEIDDNELIVTIVDAGHRSDIYR